jgi:hypothetical protein
MRGPPGRAASRMQLQDNGKTSHRQARRSNGILGRSWDTANVIGAEAAS